MLNYQLPKFKLPKLKAPKVKFFGLKGAKLSRILILVILISNDNLMILTRSIVYLWNMVS